jgi:hypothetical protein
MLLDRNDAPSHSARRPFWSYVLELIRPQLNLRRGNALFNMAEAAKSSHALFISYSSEDKAIAEALCAALESEGISCWIAPRNVKAGRPYSGTDYAGDPGSTKSSSDPERRVEPLRTCITRGRTCVPLSRSALADRHSFLEFASASWLPFKVALLYNTPT